MARLADGKTPQEVLSYLKDVRYPVLKHDLVHSARHNGAPADIISALQSLPQNSFAKPEEVIEAYPPIE